MRGRAGSTASKKAISVRRERLQMVALVVIVVGFFSMVFRFSELPNTVNAARNREAAALPTMRGAASPPSDAASATKRDPTVPAVTIITQLQQQTQEPKATEATEATEAATAAAKPATDSPPPPQTPEPTLSAAEQRIACQNERDYGLIDVIRTSAREFCTQNSNGAKDATQVSLYDVAGGIKSSVFRNLELNMAGVRIHRPIQNLSQDGGSHDPRFVFTNSMIHCSCSELAQAARDAKKPLVLWDPTLSLVNTKIDPISTVCDPSQVTLPPAEEGDDNVVVFTDPVILISRRDDHNPFFQVSNALNSWIMAKALGWNLKKTRVIHFDAGYPSPVDALHQKLLSPNHELVRGETLMGKRVVFKSDAMLAPWEVSGPMMQHLNDREPCRSSQLMQDFRHLALQTMGAPMTKQHVVDVIDDEKPQRSSSTVVVTVITRRPYGGRKVQRVWVNEDEILAKMREEYRDLNVVFQSVEFVDLPLDKQMEVIVNSDVVIGMHGAGMVNIFWTRPETLVVEIFPKQRRRWGYRNLCQFLGCDWHEFRGGTDIGKEVDANTKDKRIEYDEWKKFFDGLLRKRYAQVEAQQNGEV